jgi:hypothetical protein
MWVGAGGGSSQPVTHAKHSGSCGSLLGSTQSSPRASRSVARYTIVSFKKEFGILCMNCLIVEY